MTTSPLPRLATDPRVATQPGIQPARARLVELEVENRALLERVEILRATLDAEAQYAGRLLTLNEQLRRDVDRSRRCVLELHAAHAQLLAEVDNQRALAAAIDRAAFSITGKTAAELRAELAAPPVTDDPFAPVCTTVGFASGTEPCDRFEETVVRDEEGGM